MGTAVGYRVEVRDRTHGECVQKARFQTLADARVYQSMCGTGEGYFVVCMIESSDGWDLVVPDGWEDVDDWEDSNV